MHFNCPATDATLTTIRVEFVEPTHKELPPLPLIDYERSLPSRPRLPDNAVRLRREPPLSLAAVAPEPRSLPSAPAAEPLCS
jgi:hypothetical protein